MLGSEWHKKSNSVFCCLNLIDYDLFLLEYDQNSFANKEEKKGRKYFVLYGLTVFCPTRFFAVHLNVAVLPMVADTWVEFRLFKSGGCWVSVKHSKGKKLELEQNKSFNWLYYIQDPWNHPKSGACKPRI